MVKSRRNASSSGVPNVLSRWMSRSGPASPSSGVLALFGGGLLRGRQFLRCHLAAEGRDLDRLRPEPHVRQAEAPADDPAVLEERLDLVGMRRRADVEVLRAPAEQQVADAAADEIRDVAVLMEAIEDFERVGIDLRSGERVRGSLAR